MEFFHRLNISNQAAQLLVWGKYVGCPGLSAIGTFIGIFL